jgi:hypothetical protein
MLTPIYKITPIQRKKFFGKIYKNWGIVYFGDMEISQKSYRRKVDSYTVRNLNYEGIIVPDGMTIDHKFPVSVGYRLNIPPEYIADLRNIEFIPLRDNIMKGNECNFIPHYIQEYMLGIVKLQINRDTKALQIKGIKRAKELGRYTGRKVGSRETPELFFEKEKTKKVVELRKLGLGKNGVSVDLSISWNTVDKIFKMMDKYPHLVK